MKFGTKVIVTRGSSDRQPGEKGSLREIKGILKGAVGGHKVVQLTEDDPLAAFRFCTKAGDIGVWPNSCVRKDG